MLSLTLADFVATLPFSNKIEDRQVQPFVARSMELDIEPLLGWPVLEAVQLLPDALVLPYSLTQAVNAGDYMARRERVYLALAGAVTPALPADGVSNAEWLYEPLHTLWSQYLKQYWLHASFARFLAQAGFDLTKAGLTTPTDPQGTFRPASAADRATVQASIDTTTEALRSRLTAFLRTESQAYSKDNTTGYRYNYGADTCHPSTSNRTRLRGINRRR